MVRVTIEVCVDGARHRIAVRAASIPGALGLAEEYHLDGEARVVFPIEADEFFVDGLSAAAGCMGCEQVPSDAANGPE